MIFILPSISSSVGSSSTLSGIEVCDVDRRAEIDIAPIFSAAAKADCLSSTFDFFRWSLESRRPHADFGGPGAAADSDVFPPPEAPECHSFLVFPRVELSTADNEMFFGWTPEK